MTEQGANKTAAEKRIYSLLGLAARAGRLVSGNYMTEQAVRDGKARLVVVAADAGDTTRKLFRNKCASYHVPLLFVGEREGLGRAIGRQWRSAAAVTDPGLADAVQKLAQDGE